MKRTSWILVLAAGWIAGCTSGPGDQDRIADTDVAREVSPEDAGPDAAEVVETSPETVGPDAADVAETSPETVGPDAAEVAETSPETVGPDAVDVAETSPETVGPDAVDVAETSPETVGPDAVDVAETSPETAGPDAADVADTSPETVGPDAADALERDLPEDLDAPGVPEALDVDAGEGDDGPPPSPWEGLAGTGLPVGEIVGVASHMSNGPEPDPLRDFEFQQYKEFHGFRARRGLRWNHVQPTKDSWNIEKVQTPVQMAPEYEVRFLPMLAYGVGWAEADGETYGSIDIHAYAAYAGGMAKAFCSTTKEYEIWNEQNITRFWDPVPDPAKYADLLVASAAAIRAECPDARVVYGGMSSYEDLDLWNRWGFLRSTLEARPDLCDAFDILALHPYTWFQYDPPEHDEVVDEEIAKQGQTWMTQIARDILAGAGCSPKPIYFTELGWPTYELTEAQVGRYAARSLLLAARDGVDGWYWYTFWDDPPDASGIRPHENHFGLFAWPGEDGTVRRAKPAWEAVKAIGSLLDRHRFARDLGPALALPNDVYVLAFLDDVGQVTLALWDGREMPDVSLEGTFPGGPDTTFDLALPLPACTVATTLRDQAGALLPSPGAGPTVSLTLKPEVQYLAIDCDGDR